MHVQIILDKPLEALYSVRTLNTEADMKFKITWNGKGGELDSIKGEGDEYAGAITKALIKMLQKDGGGIITPGDSFEIEEIE
jgi:hypothetical protein